MPSVLSLKRKSETYKTPPPRDAGTRKRVTRSSHRDPVEDVKDHRENIERTFFDFDGPWNSGSKLQQSQAAQMNFKWSLHTLEDFKQDQIALIGETWLKPDSKAHSFVEKWRDRSGFGETWLKPNSEAQRDRFGFGDLGGDLGGDFYSWKTWAMAKRWHQQILNDPENFDFAKQEWLTEDDTDKARPPKDEAVPNTALVLTLNSLLLFEYTKFADHRQNCTTLQCFPKERSDYYGQSVGYTVMVDGGLFMNPGNFPMHTFTNQTGVLKIIFEAKTARRALGTRWGLAKNSGGKHDGDAHTTHVEWQEASEMIAWISTHPEAHDDVSMRPLRYDMKDLYQYQRMSIAQCGDEIWLNFARYNESYIRYINGINEKGESDQMSIRCYGPFKTGMEAHLEVLFDVINGYVRSAIEQATQRETKGDDSDGEGQRVIEDDGVMNEAPGCRSRGG